MRASSFRTLTRTEASRPAMSASSASRCMFSTSTVVMTRARADVPTMRADAGRLNLAISSTSRRSICTDVARLGVASCMRADTGRFGDLSTAGLE